MAQSLKSRFNGNSEEVLECVKIWGIQETMRRYDVADYVAMKKWIIEVTGDENYGIYPVLGVGDTENDTTPYDKLVEAIKKSFLAVDAVNKRLTTDNERLRRENQYLRTHDKIQADAKTQQLITVMQQVET